jgi:hypothetical protein
MKRYEIVSQHGTTRSEHNTLDAAEKALARLLNRRCGICGSNRSGWGKCSHGGHNRVCSADHYNDRIIDHACERCGAIGNLRLGYCTECYEYMVAHQCNLCPNRCP